MTDPTSILVQSPDGQQTLLVEPGSDAALTDILRHRAIPLNTRCGGKGLCDGCRCELLAGQLENIATGERVRPAEHESIELLACEYRVVHNGPIVIRVPQRSLLAYQPQVVSDFRLNIPLAHDPLWHPPDKPKAEQVGERSPGPVHATTTPPLAAAIDIGTTTVAVAIIDLTTGHVLAKSSAFNRQMHFGDDVLTRINLCMTDAAKLTELHEAVAVGTLTPLIHEALDAAEAPIDRLVCMTIAANTTMLHLLAREDPSPLGLVPFTPRFLEHRRYAAADLHLPGHAEVHLLPGAAAYIGADLTAGVVSSGLHYDEGPSLLVDVGTNGEIILKHKGKLHACATAAGPAFEGSRLTSGMRAGQGAISHINMAANPADVQFEVIGNVKPTGLCGSAYVDFLAHARMVGLLSESGRFVDGVADDRLEQVPDYGRSFRVATGEGHKHIDISEADIASLLQAKGAIGAGIVTLLQRAGLEAGDVRALYLAGGFGMHMDIANAIACGLLPGFAPDQVQLVGNTSLAGAYVTLLDRSVLDEIARVSSEMEVVELNLDPNFEMNYIDQLSLP
jgi:uncharacterized 2Fe-2S/4Fe-4S cluster protein (DUF4445 family)